MITIFIDESGDLGFNKKSSNNFIIGLLITKNPAKIRRCIRKVLKTIKKRPQELHWNASSNTIKKRALNRLESCDFEAKILVVNKKTIYNHLQEKKDKLYHFLAGLIIEEAQFDEKHVQVIFDKRSGNKFVQNDLSTYILNKISEQNFFIRAKVEHRLSHEERGIQAIDIICGAAFSKFEYDRSEFLEIVKNKVLLKRKF